MNTIRVATVWHPPGTLPPPYTQAQTHSSSSCLDKVALAQHTPGPLACAHSSSCHPVRVAPAWSTPGHPQPVSTPAPALSPWWPGCGGGAQWELQQRVRNYKKEPIRAQEYSNWNEIYTKGNQHQIRWYRRTDQWSRRQNNGNLPKRTAKKKKKRILKNENSLRSLWDNIKHTNIHIIGLPEGDERKQQETYLKK